MNIIIIRKLLCKQNGSYCELMCMFWLLCVDTVRRDTSVVLCALQYEYKVKIFTYLIFYFVCLQHLTSILSVSGRFSVCKQYHCNLLHTCTRNFCITSPIVGYAESAKSS